MQIEEAVKEIVKRYGKEELRNTYRINAILRDLAPEYPKERKIISNIFSESIAECFLSPAGNAVKARLLLQDMGLAEEWIEYFIKIFGGSVGWDVESSASAETKAPAGEKRKEIAKKPNEDCSEQLSPKNGQMAKPIPDKAQISPGKTKSKTQKKKRKKKIPKLVVLFLVLAILGAGGFFGYNAYNNISYISQIKQGDMVTFGQYEQDGNLSNGKEPIVWMVLKVENDRALLLSKYGLDAQAYDDNAYGNWETCTLRKWLNDIFFQEAFGWSDKAIIIPEENDWLFLLKLMDKTENLTTMECEATRYAQTRGAYVDQESGNAIWWLYSYIISEEHGTYARAVSTSGQIHYYAADTSSVLVRPALWVSLDWKRHLF